MKKMLLIVFGMIFFNLLLQAEVTILSENFEGDVSSWAFGSSGQTNHWYCGYATSNNGSKSAYISSNGGSGAIYNKTSASTSWLEKTVDLSEFSSANLSFYWKCNGQGGAIPNDYGEVYINNHLVSGLREYVGVNTWTFEPGIDISDYVGEIVTLKFKWANNNLQGNDPPFCVDDVLISGEYGHDFATLSYSEDNQSINDMIVHTGETVQFHVVVKNVGLITESSSIKWTCSGGSPLSDTDETTTVLAPNESVDHNFYPNWIAPNTAGTYTAQFYTDLSNDVNAENDTTTVTITVLETQSIPYSQTFDSTIPNALPEGWTQENLNNDGYAWQTNDNYPRSMLNNAVIGGNIVRSMDDWLYSCPLQMNANTTYRVSFWTALSVSSNPQKIKVHWGDSPSSFDMSATSIFDETLSSLDYEEKICYLTPSLSGIYYIGWHGYGDAGSSALFIDDIQVKEVKPNDFATLSYMDDARSMHDLVVAPNTELPISIVVRNEGSNAQSSTVSWSVNGGLPLTNSETTSYLTQGQSERYIFSTNWIAPSVAGDYTMNIYTALSGDQDSSNDLTTIVISVVEPLTIPYSENFDNVLIPDLPTGWSIENTNRDFRQWKNSDFSSDSGTNHMSITESPYLDMNDWVFSSPLVLEAGKIYHLSFMYSTGGVQQNIEVKLGTQAKSQNMTLGTLFSDTTNEAYYLEGTATFSPTEDGVYYLGWHGYTPAEGYLSSILNFDSVVITEEQIHDFSVLSYDDDNRSMKDIMVLAGSSVEFNVVAKNLGSYTESSPIKWNCSGGTPLSDTDENTIELAPGETENHIFSPNWQAPAISGDYTLTFYTDLSNDSDSLNNSVSIKIKVLDNCTLPIMEDFESGLVSFVNDYATTKDWMTNSTLYHSGANSVWSDYTADNENILIQNCAMDLTSYSFPHLTFYQIAKLEAINDKGFVEVSTDLGETWTTLTANEYYGNSTNFGGKDYFDETSYSDWGSGNETPTNSWWKREIFDLSNYKTESQVMVRFRLTSNSTINRAGWLIDDIAIQELAEPYAAYSPTPQDSDNDIYAYLPKLTWENGYGTSQIDLYFDSNYSSVNVMNPTVKLIDNQNVSEYILANPLDFGTTYYWRIVSKNANGDKVGSIWSFTTLGGSSDRIEDFESGNFNSFPWQFSGDANWFVQSSNVLQGTYSAQSGEISHNQEAILSIDLTVTQNGYISFNIKTDTEENFDKLVFYIDGVEKGSWSGITEQTSKTFSVNSGFRTFKWSYKKNISASSGTDTVWLDSISFPPFESTSIAAPSNVMINLNGNNVELGWDSVAGASSYNIYRSTDADSGFGFIDSTEGNSYVDAGALLNSDKYFYRITAIGTAK